MYFEYFFILLEFGLIIYWYRELMWYFLEFLDILGFLKYITRDGRRDNIVLGEFYKCLLLFILS